MRLTDILLFGPPVFLSVLAIIVSRVLGRPPKVIAAKTVAPASAVVPNDSAVGD